MFENLRTHRNVCPVEPGLWNVRWPEQVAAKELCSGNAGSCDLNRGLAQLHSSSFDIRESLASLGHEVAGSTADIDQPRTRSDRTLQALQEKAKAVRPCRIELAGFENVGPVRVPVVTRYIAGSTLASLLRRFRLTVAVGHEPSFACALAEERSRNDQHLRCGLARLLFSPARVRLPADRFDSRKTARTLHAVFIGSGSDELSRCDCETGESFPIPRRPRLDARAGRRPSITLAS
jgi:hypothetical protein